MKCICLEVYIDDNVYPIFIHCPENFTYRLSPSKKIGWGITV
ncbi:hypothetical protein BSM4216_0442 [Bacillus smithii]|nr:hypothetical protein BSM4216_0442 [Bacillus smithii]